MKVYIGLRLYRSLDAEAGINNIGGEILNSRLEVKDPAFRNLVEGLDIESGNTKTTLHWLLVDTQTHNAEELFQFNEVEVAFTFDWFEQQKELVRHLKGVEYYDATRALASILDVKNSNRSIKYSVRALTA